MSSDATTIRLGDLRDSFDGGLPAVIATAAADGTPNVTYLSKVHLVDRERVALSNQFLSKTARNLAENPRASVLVVDPNTGDQFRLALVYERTDRRGPLFERLRDEVDAIAAFSGMQEVFKLRAADIYRVGHIEQVRSGAPRRGEDLDPARRTRSDTIGSEPLAALTARLSRCPDLDTLVDVTVTGLAELFGYEHSSFLLLDEDGRRLYTIASHGYETEGVGSEVEVGDGIIGTAAARSAPITVGDAHFLAKYSSAVRRSFEESGEIGPGRQIPLPGLVRAKSRVAVPAMALGELTGVLTVESLEPVAFGPADEAILSAVSSLLAHAVQAARAMGSADEIVTSASAARGASPRTTDPPAHVRFYAVDGSTFVDGDYLIKGVAGRILWSLLGAYDRDRRVEFTHREVRLDPRLQLPAFRDNFEGRLILLKRRLDERSAPVRIDKTGRGRFRLHVDKPLRLDEIPDPAS